ncbi:MAG: hypothetical protein E3J64_09560, partial [Anaerolineales bacterium]
MRSLRQCLLDANLVRLRVIAEFWNLETEAKRRRDLAAELAEGMSERIAIARAWQALPDDQRSALEELLALGGRAPRRVLARHWGDIRPAGPGRMDRERPWHEPASPIEGLWYSGFLFRAFAGEEQGSHEEFFVPAELMKHLPVPAPHRRSLSIQPSPQPAVIAAAGDGLLDDVCTFLAYAQNRRLRPSPQGDWPEHHEERLTAQLRSPDRTRLALLRHLAAQLHWVRQGDSGQLRLDPTSVVNWLKSTTGQQRTSLATAWAEDPAWNDLHHVPGLTIDKAAAWHNDSLRARKAIMDHLSICAVEEWYRIADFVGAIKETDPDFQRPGGDYSSWYIRDSASGVYLSGFECWDQVEGALIRFTIVGLLPWLGLVDLGAESPSDPSCAFRLTAAGAAFLSREEMPADLPAPQPAVRPDMTIHVPAPRRYPRFQLARGAAWVRTGDHYVYRLCGSSLERARRQGISVERILEFLREATGKPLARSVELAITRWETEGTQATLAPVV